MRDRRVLRQHRGATEGNQRQGSEPGCTSYSGAAGHRHGPGAAAGWPFPEGTAHCGFGTAETIAGPQPRAPGTAAGQRRARPGQSGCQGAPNPSPAPRRSLSAIPPLSALPSGGSRRPAAAPLRRPGCRRAGLGRGSVPQGRPGTRPERSSASLVPPRGRSGPPRGGPVSGSGAPPPAHLMLLQHLAEAGVPLRDPPVELGDPHGHSSPPPSQPRRNQTPRAALRPPSGAPR